jgi:hypothetical protein
LAALVLAPGCADPCVDDGVNQENKGEDCPAITASASATESASETETESDSLSMSASMSVTDDATAGTQSATEATATETESDSLTADATAEATAADTTDGSGECPVLDITVAHEDPTIMLLLDQSGSMTADFGGDTRWNTLRNTILDPDIGVVVWFESQVIFGLTLYSNLDNVPECPELVQVPPMEMGYDAIAAAFDAAQPIDNTPTGESIAAVAAQLADDPAPGAKYIVLATDGEPDTCAEPNPQNGQEESVAAAEAAYAAGIPTFVVSVGPETSAEHLQDVANAGAGVQAGDPDAEFFVALDQPSLAQAFIDIISGTQDCEFDIDADLIAGGAETCVVTVNGDPVTLDDPDGWQTISPGEIELLGSACDAIQDSEATVEMVCQCDAVEGR